MTNGNFSGGRNALLPIIFSLVAFVFLQIFQIKISFLIWIALLIVIFFVSLLLSIRSKISLTSKIPNIPNVRTIIVVLVVLILASTIFILVFDKGPGMFNYYLNRIQEGFDDNEYKYTVQFNSESGQASAKEGRLIIFGDVKIINNDVFYPNPKLGFDILVAEGKTAVIEVTFRDVAITGETSFNFTVEGSRSIQEVRFGIKNQSQIWAEVDGREPDNFKKSSDYFNSNVPYNVILGITGDKMGNRCAVNIDNLGLGAFWRL